MLQLLAYSDDDERLFCFVGLMFLFVFVMWKMHSADETPKGGDAQ